MGDVQVSTIRKGSSVVTPPNVLQVKRKKKALTFRCSAQLLSSLPPAERER